MRSILPLRAAFVALAQACPAAAEEVRDVSTGELREEVIGGARCAGGGPFGLQIGFRTSVDYKTVEATSLEGGIDGMTLTLSDGTRAVAFYQLQGETYDSASNCIELIGRMVLPAFTDPDVAFCFEEFVDLVARHEMRHRRDREDAMRSAYSEGNYDLSVPSDRAALSDAHRVLWKDMADALDGAEGLDHTPPTASLREVCPPPGMSVSVVGAVTSEVMSLISQPGYRELLGYWYPSSAGENAVVPAKYRHFVACGPDDVAELRIATGPDVAVTGVTVSGPDRFDAVPAPIADTDGSEVRGFVIRGTAQGWVWAPERHRATVQVTLDSELHPRISGTFIYSRQSNVPGSFNSEGCVD